MSLVSVLSKLVASIILHRVSSTRGRCMLGNLVGFPPGWSSIDHVFTLQNVIEHRHIVRRPVISLMTLESDVTQSIVQFFGAISLKYVSEKFISLCVPTVET